MISGEERGRGAAAEGGSMGEAQEEGNMETDKIDNSEICTQFIWYLRNRLHLTLFGTVGRGLGYFFLELISGGERGLEVAQEAAAEGIEALEKGDMETD